MFKLADPKERKPPFEKRSALFLAQEPFVPRSDQPPPFPLSGRFCWPPARAALPLEVSSPTENQFLPLTDRPDFPPSTEALGQAGEIGQLFYALPRKASRTARLNPRQPEPNHFLWKFLRARTCQFQRRKQGSISFEVHCINFDPITLFNRFLAKGVTQIMLTFFNSDVSSKKPRVIPLKRLEGYCVS